MAYRTSAQTQAGMYWARKRRSQLFGGNPADNSPVNIARPQLTTLYPQVSRPVGLFVGTWETSIQPVTYSYAWRMDATPVGTNTSSYTPVAGDVGKILSCVVTASNSVGSNSALTPISQPTIP